MRVRVSVECTHTVDRVMTGDLLLVTPGTRSADPHGDLHEDLKSDMQAISGLSGDGRRFT